MSATIRSNSAGPNPKKPPRVVGWTVVSATTRRTVAEDVYFVCVKCGAIHKVTRYGYRVTACRRGLVDVVDIVDIVSGVR